MILTARGQETPAEGDKQADAVDSNFVHTLRAKYNQLSEELKKYDQQKSGKVTKTEFRNALEAAAGEPISPRLFDKIVEGAGFAIDYASCLDRVGVPILPPTPQDGKRASKTPSQGRLTRSLTMQPSAAQDIEETFKQNLHDNITKVLRGLRLFDFNRDCRIQKHELKKTFDTHVMKMTDPQFDRIWSRYEVNHNSGTTTTNYHDFLRRLGVTDEQFATVGSGAKSVLTESVVAPYKEHSQSVPNSRGESATSLRPVSTFRHVVRNEDLPNRSQHLSESNIDFLENQVRSGVVTNRFSIVKMFNIFDRDGTGYISLDDLHKTISNFVVQLSFPVFQQVMERLGLKASHTIAWRTFMRKFDPITYGEQQNGSYLPMRSNHRYLPPKGLTDQKLSLNALMAKLHEHIHKDYPSLKEAFLLIDEKRDGFITSKKIQKLLSDSVKMPVTDEIMAELWGLLQPAGSPPLDYPRFVKLFEMNNTSDSQMWLNSTHHVNDVREPPPLVGPQAAELVRQHAVTNWRTIAAELTMADRKKHNIVKVSKLKSILEGNIGEIDDATFNKWVNQCSTHTGDNVNYREFFTKVGVEINPGDIEGLSLRIQQDNELEINKHIVDQHRRQVIEAQKAGERANMTTIDEIIVRLADRFEQKTTNFYKTFAYFAKKRKQAYRLSRAGFRKMLNHMGFLLTDENFAELCNRLQFTGHHMGYEDFVHNFELLFFQAPSDVERKDNHRFNEIRGAKELMNADEGYAMFKAKLLKNFDTLKDAFSYADVERRSVISSTGVLRLFDSLNIPLNPACIGEVMQKLGDELKRPSLTLLSLDDFRTLFEFREDERGHKWTSDHRWNEQLEGPAPTTPEGARQMLMLKLRTQFNSPTEAFLAADPRRTGRIRKRDLAYLLAKLHMSIGEPVLSGLWDLFDPLREGSVNMDSFFRRSGVDNPGDAEGGISEKIINKNEASLEEFAAQMKGRHQLATDRQVAVGQSLTAELALGTIAQKLVDTGQSLDALYAKFDTKRRGFLSPQQVQQILYTYHLFLPSNEEQRLFKMLGIGVEGRSAVTQPAFKAAFSDQNVTVGNETAQKDPNEIHFSKSVNPDKLSYAAASDLWKKARIAFTRNVDVIQKGFAALDKSSSGRLPLADFEQVLAAFCGAHIPLAFIRQRFPPSVDGTVDYRGFLSSVVTTQSVPAVSASALLNASNSNSEQAAGVRRLAQAVRAHHYQLMVACEELDWSRYGWLGLQDFRNVLQQFTIPITEQLFKYLTSLPDVVPTNENGNVLYREALSALGAIDHAVTNPSGEALPGIYNEEEDLPEEREESADQLPPIDDTGIMRMGAARSAVSSSRASSTIASSMITDLFAFDDSGYGGMPMVDAAQAENQLYPIMAKRWRRFHRACRAADPQQTGFLPTPAVDKIFQDLGITLHDNDFQIVCRKYDLKNSGSFAYRHFLRQMVLSKSGVSLGDGKEESSPKLPNIRGLLSTAERWRDLRKWFRSQPQVSPGVISIAQLRHGLRTIADANMSEEEFAELTNRLDPQTTGYLRFDDLFRLALKTTTSSIS